MRPTTATDDNVFDFQALLHPGTVFEHPKGRADASVPDAGREASNPRLLGIGRFGDRLLSCSTRSGRPEECRSASTPSSKPYASSMAVHGTRPVESRNAGFPRRARRPAEGTGLNSVYPAGARRPLRHSETIPSIRQEMRDLRGKLRLRVGFREACDVYHFTSFQLSEPRRKQDRKSRILAAHFSGQFDSCHPWHRVVGYQKVSGQSTFKKPQRLSGGMRFNHLVSQVFQ